MHNTFDYFEARQLHYYFSTQACITYGRIVAATQSVLCILYMNNYSDNMTRELSVIAKYLEVLLELPTLLLYCV